MSDNFCIWSNILSDHFRKVKIHTVNGHVETQSNLAKIMHYIQ